MFDAIKLEQALIDMYDCGVTDNTLSILYSANKEIGMAINTPHGITERQLVKSTVLQGDTWASILASVEVDAIAKNCQEAELGYLYRSELMINSLGLVDDIIGITEPGHKAHQMNVIMNVRSADKTLQFGSDKCKKMFVGKKCDTDMTGDLSVDEWRTEYVQYDSYKGVRSDTCKGSDSLSDGVSSSTVTGGGVSDRTTMSETSENELVLLETFSGCVRMESVNEWKYLGFVISNSNDNLANIRTVKTKSIGTIKSIFGKLKSLNLQKYFFECSILFKNSMLRTSILYASETYYYQTKLS